MPRKAKKGSPRYYFTQKTEDAITRYNKEERAYMKQRIYNDHIRRAFDKLCENIIHTFKFYYFDVPSEDVKHEVVSFLYMNMQFYLSVVIVGWLRFLLHICIAMQSNAQRHRFMCQLELVFGNIKTNHKNT